MSQSTLFLFGVVISFIVFTGVVLYGMYTFSAWHKAETSVPGAQKVTGSSPCQPGARCDRQHGS
jgi:hypothetical protein